MQLEPLFETDRLQVFRFECVPLPGEFDYLRQVYVGFRTNAAVAFPAVTLTTCGECQYEDGVLVELVETSALGGRREGLATEMWRGVEDFLGKPLRSAPVTREGRALLDSLGVPYDREKAGEAGLLDGE